MSKRILWALPLPFLVALHPLVALFATNRHELLPADLLRPLGVTAGAVIVLLGLLLALARPERFPRAAIASALFWLVFFSQDMVDGYFASLLDSFTVNSLPREVVRGIAFALALVGMGVVLRQRRDPQAAVVPLLIAGGALWVPPLLTLGRAVPSKPAPVIAAPPPAHQSALPDLYVVILDAYGRADQLRRLYGIDNTPFLQALEKRGFTVASHSRANYTQTHLALTAALDGSYLTSAPAGFDAFPQLLERLDHNRTVTTLRRQGFETILIPTGYPLDQSHFADRVLNPETRAPESLTSLERLLLLRSPLDELLRYENRAANEHRQRLRNAFTSLEQTAAAPNPKLVITHLLAPHPPFVFGPHGEAVTQPGYFTFDDGSSYQKDHAPASYRQGYTDQLHYVNQRLLQALDTIQRTARRPHVIVVMGDHGSRGQLDWYSRERTDLDEVFSNLVAVAPPDSKPLPWLKGTISPVNLFRLLLTDYYGQNFPRLPDRSFYSGLANPFVFEEVTNRLGGSASP